MVNGTIAANAKKLAVFLPNLSPMNPPSKEPNNNPMTNTVPKKLFLYSLSHIKSNLVTTVSSK